MKTNWKTVERADGLPCITREASVAFCDEYEMSGRGTDCFVRYGVREDGTPVLQRHVVFPRLRTIPNNTHASFQCDLPEPSVPTLCVDGTPMTETAEAFSLYGVAETVSRAGELRITRQFFPCREAQGMAERWTVENGGETAVTLALLPPQEALCCRGRGTKGVYLVETQCEPMQTVLQPGKRVTVPVAFAARVANQTPVPIDVEAEWNARMAEVRLLCTEQMHLETGDATFDTLFALAKLRAGESIFRMSDGKLLHSPGGRAYYAATWCNDQVEYAGPHFALTGDAQAIEASMNAYRQYMPFMDARYTKLPCSVIAEGLDIWEGAGDRGDAAMYLYGASLFALYCGKEEIARELFGAICWCAEYCRRKRTEDGVIGSDSDELEGRFPTDRKANLSTSMLALGGYRLASLLAESLGETEKAIQFRTLASELQTSAERYFGATLHGFETYRYSKGFDTLRGWLSLPLCMGMERKQGTVAAIRSPYLWTEKGMLSCELGPENTNATVWDRAALYGFKGLFLAGEAEAVDADLRAYCESRLLGERVPYPVEAWPEGDARHLSGESALFCRVVTEGILGIEPLGLHAFRLTPRVPRSFARFSLRALSVCGHCVDIFASKQNGTFVFTVSENGRVIASGKNGEPIDVRWNA